MRHYSSVVLFGALVLAFSCDQEDDHAKRGSAQKSTPPGAGGSLSKESEPIEGPSNATVRPPSLAPVLSTEHVDEELRGRSITEQQAYLLWLLESRVNFSSAQLARARTIISQARWLSFGNPEVSVPALSQKECAARWAARAPHPADSVCAKQNMVLASGPGGKVCIDQFEFPNLVCEYPVVWVRASEAAGLCEAAGKRLCDAHEWEGACAGSVLPRESEYLHDKLPKGIGPEYRRGRRLLMEDWHNRPREITWAYGSQKATDKCGMASSKSPKCRATTYQACGTNNYPAGSFPECVSPVGAYDQHGNVAEHMSLPLFPEEFGGFGWTEMKGSWFIAAETHPDDCRWRAKNWHTTKVTDPNSHDNYHLGFRCCADVPASESEKSSAP